MTDRKRTSQKDNLSASGVKVVISSSWPPGLILPYSPANLNLWNATVSSMCHPGICHPLNEENAALIYNQLHKEHFLCSFEIFFKLKVPIKAGMPEHDSYLLRVSAPLPPHSKGPLFPRAGRLHNPRPLLSYPRARTSRARTVYTASAHRVTCYVKD